MFTQLIPSNNLIFGSEMNVNWTPTLQKEFLHKSRHDSSLIVLARKVVDLLCKTPIREVGLNDATEMLSASKRRIYDVINILEGIGLVEKIGRDTVRWRLVGII